MKKFLLHFVLALAVTVTLYSCKYSKEYREVKAGNKFSISVPEWLKEEAKLKPGADFQYANRFRNFYAIGEEIRLDTTSSALQTKMSENIAILRKSMANTIVSDSMDVTYGGLKGVRAEVFGKMNNENIYFTEVLLQGPQKSYHLSLWTRGEDRKLKYKNDINQILASFKPL